MPLLWLTIGTMLGCGAVLALRRERERTRVITVHRQSDGQSYVRSRYDDDTLISTLRTLADNLECRRILGEGCE